MYLYFLNKQNLDLSVAEVLALANSEKYELVNNCLLIDELVDYKRLAYTKRIYKLLFLTDKKNLLKDLKSFNFNKVYKKSFKLSLVNSPGYDVGELADIIWDNLKNPKADMKNPKTILEIIFSQKIFACLRLWENKEKFEERKAHLRPYNHPTSLHPRLARCLVNLSTSNQVVDTFCGSGGILIEAGLISLKAVGYDTDEIMLKRAKKNLDSFKIKNYELHNKDALKVNKKYKSIVTDLPYGKNSRVKDLEKTYFEFLNNSFNFVEKMILVFPDFVNGKKLIKKTGWKIKNNFSYYIHKSLTKEIFVLIK
ncbi:MAG: methyltransferase domain-containing protein [Nanoarchaeota archaeon]|nr:methyltransferase domain-containing protein [DPANN group archaeon]MBL7116328.1 methyltransferase domain-containing protein [Nanoarchaeota archaeon]